jgi:response regulator RpfG family c-di-GMP phosphodiesterase
MHLSTLPKPLNSSNGLLNNSEPTSIILVVDDDESTRSVIVEALEMNSLTVLEAENGLDALKLLQNHACDLIISDIKMPGMSGIDLLNKVMEANPDMHMIMITGYPTLDLTVSAIKTGAIDFLAKPFDVEELVHKIQIYLGEKKILSEEAKKEKRDSQRLNEKVNELSTRSLIYDSIENTTECNERIFHEMAELALKLVGGESCSILLYDVESNRFHPKIIKSSTYDLYRNEILPSLNSYFLEVVSKKKPILKNTHDRSDIVNSLICVPLSIRNHIFGILTLSRKKTGLEFTPKDLNYIISLTKRASLNLENKILYESTYQNIIDTFRSLAASIQLRDHYTEEHSLRVTDMAIKIAKAMDLPEHEIESLKISGTLHDIGKIAIPDNILLKPDKLTMEEFSIIKNHSIIGENILKPVLLFENETRTIRHHHERWDGQGYPDGLTGNAIPLNSRILAVIDSFDAMTNNRPYRKALKLDKALNELTQNSGLQFDKKVVDTFLKIL